MSHTYVLASDLARDPEAVAPGSCGHLTGGWCRGCGRHVLHAASRDERWLVDRGAAYCPGCTPAYLAQACPGETVPDRPPCPTCVGLGRVLADLSPGYSASGPCPDCQGSGRG